MVFQPVQSVPIESLHNRAGESQSTFVPRLYSRVGLDRVLIVIQRVDRLVPCFCVSGLGFVSCSEDVPLFRQRDNGQNWNPKKRSRKATSCVGTCCASAYPEVSSAGLVASFALHSSRRFASSSAQSFRAGLPEQGCLFDPGRFGGLVDCPNQKGK